MRPCSDSRRDRLPARLADVDAVNARVGVVIVAGDARVDVSRAHRDDPEPRRAPFLRAGKGENLLAGWVRAPTGNAEARPAVRRDEHALIGADIDVIAVKEYPADVRAAAVAGRITLLER